MHKHSLPSIEQFAAYLDNNLSQSDMQQFSQLAEHDGALHQLLDASDAVDDTIAGFTDTDLQLPPEISNQDFELPEIGKSDNSMTVDDRFAEIDNLYQQEGIQGEEQLLDDVFDEMDIETDDVYDMDVGIGDEIADNIDDILDM